MPATSEKQIYNFENNFERATKAVLDAASLCDTYIQGATESSLPASRIEITFATGEAMNEATYPLDEEQRIYDFYNGRLTLRIVTERPETSSSLISGVATLHEEWAAAVRMLLQERLSPYTTDNLPHYAVKTIRPVGTTRDLDPRWLEDFTRLDFLVEFGIRSTAWPVAG